MKPSEENMPFVKTSEEHIYTYDTDKNKKKRPETPGRSTFKIICMVLGGVGAYLLFFALFLIIRGGFSDSNFNDINANCRYAMIILSVFVLFIAFAGYSGAYTNWKPIILTFSVLTSMALLGHLYVAKKTLDAVRFTERDMAVSWWDIYDDYTRQAIQDKYKCCGYKDYNDLSVGSNYCLIREVEIISKYSDNVKDPADVKRNDSYRKKFGTADSVGGGPKGQVGNANQTTQQTTQQDTQQQTTQQDTQQQAPQQDTQQQPEPQQDTQQPEPQAQAGAPAGAQAGQQAGGMAFFGKRDINNVFSYEQEILRRRAVIQSAQENQIQQELAIRNTEGCRKFIVEKIQSKLKYVYIFNYALSLVYIAAVAQSLIYWQHMRKEKEFDEFA